MTITELETPALLLDYCAMQQNMDILDNLVQGSFMKPYPHYKTHKCPQIAKMQMERGAAGITCAKLSEADDLAKAGIENVVIANEVVQYEKLPKLASLAHMTRLTVCVDSAENILDLEEACRKEKALLYLFVEYDVGSHRCGVSTWDEVLSLAQLISQQEHLRFSGLQAYGGHLGHETDPDVRRQKLMAMEEDVRGLRDYLEEHGLRVYHVGGGSTVTCVDTPQDTVFTQLQAGSYLFMDSSYEPLALPFRQSLYVLTTVISAAKDRVVLDCGAKILPTDGQPPYFPAYPQAQVEFNEEHTILRMENSDLQIGDMLMCVPSHCAITLNTFDRIHVTNGSEVLHVWPITSRGKSQ